MKKITTNYTEWELLNSEKPLWTRDANEVTLEEYQSFYKTLSDYTPPFLGKTALLNLIIGKNKLKLDSKYRPHILFLNTLFKKNYNIENPDHLAFKKQQRILKNNKELVKFMSTHSLERDIESLNKKCTIKNNFKIKNIYEKSDCGKINSKKLQL